MHDKLCDKPRARACGLLDLLAPLIGVIAVLAGGGRVFGLFAATHRKRRINFRQMSSNTT